MADHEEALDLSTLEVPTHVAIIMDGNGRWARRRGLPRQAGHRAGAENLRRIIRACVEFKIKVLTIYAFSTENWGRPKTEVQALMKIFARVLDQETDELNRNGVCVHHLGDLTGIDPKLQEKVRRALELTPTTSGSSLTWPSTTAAGRKSSTPCARCSPTASSPKS